MSRKKTPPERHVFVGPISPGTYSRDQYQTALYCLLRIHGPTKIPLEIEREPRGRIVAKLDTTDMTITLMAEQRDYTE